MQDNIKELEQLKEMSEELEENQQLVEKRLRSELCTRPALPPSPRVTHRGAHRREGDPTP